MQTSITATGNGATTRIVTDAVNNPRAAFFRGRFSGNPMNLSRFFALSSTVRLTLLGSVLLAGGCAGSQQAPTVQNVSISTINHDTRDTGNLRIMSFNLRCPTIFDGLNYW